MFIFFVFGLVFLLKICLWFWVIIIGYIFLLEIKVIKENFFFCKNFLIIIVWLFVLNCWFFIIVISVCFVVVFVLVIIIFFLVVKLFVLIIIGIFCCLIYFKVGVKCWKIWYFVVGIWYFCIKFFVKFFEFLIIVVVFVGLKISNFVVWKVFIIFLINGVLGLMNV